MLPSFQDIKNNIEKNAKEDWHEFLYAPQNPVFKDTIILVNEGEDFLLNLGIDEEVSSNTYTWFKEGAFLANNSDNSISIPEMSKEEEGVYQVEIINENIPGLTLISNPITILVTEVDENQDCLSTALDLVPTAFAPNSSSFANKLFDPVDVFKETGCSLNLTKTQLTIFNRWGNIIYQPRPYEPWNGKINGNQEEAPPTTYYYTLTIGEEIIKGSINLIQVE